MGPVIGPEAPTSLILTHVQQRSCTVTLDLILASRTQYSVAGVVALKPDPWSSPHRSGPRRKGQSSTSAGSRATGPNPYPYPNRLRAGASTMSALRCLQPILPIQAQERVTESNAGASWGRGVLIQLPPSHWNPLARAPKSSQHQHALCSLHCSSCPYQGGVTWASHEDGSPAAPVFLYRGKSRHLLTPRHRSHHSIIYAGPLRYCPL